ncbi:MAG: Uma2 family endonuclease [Chloroflexota bacterium]|nr:Uma2 family endonuclease [Chloroflexota bacterium]MDE2961351.1 Uma2 family endonuclease [Chloroflexota bacterium]
MTQPKTKPRTRLTNADYMTMTPPENSGPRYQLINGEIIEMSGASDAHQVFLMWLCSGLLLQVEDLGIGEIRIPPYDVHIDEFNTYQPDLLFVSNARRHVFNPDGRGITGAPDVVVEILSDSTRRRDLNEKLPIYAANGVREVWIVDLDAATVAVHSGDDPMFAPIQTFAASDTLTSDAMPGVAIDLAPIFARARPVR